MQVISYGQWVLGYQVAFMEKETWWVEHQQFFLKLFTLKILSKVANLLESIIEQHRDVTNM